VVYNGEEMSQVRRRRRGGDEVERKTK